MIEPTLRPIPFVSGCSRSGTTLLRLMLDSHPSLAIPPECHFLHPLVSRFGTDSCSVNEAAAMITGDARWGDFGIGAREFLDACNVAMVDGIGSMLRVFYGMYAKHHGKAAWGDRSPATLDVMNSIRALIPEARFIHIIRDGRDVVTSLHGRWWVAGRSHAELIGDWVDDITNAREQAQSGAPYLEVRYEDLIADPEDVLRQVCGFIDLPFDPAMLAYHRRSAERVAELRDVNLPDGRTLTREERITKHQLTLSPPTAERIGRWQRELSPSDRAECEAVAGDLLRSLDYLA